LKKFELKFFRAKKKQNDKNFKFSNFCLAPKLKKKKLKNIQIQTCPGEEFESGLVAEYFGRGGGRDLRNAEESQEIGHLDGDGTVGAADDAENGTESFALLTGRPPVPGRRSVTALEGSRTNKLIATSTSTAGTETTGRMIHGVE
jgi:hypothetical protein